MRKKIIYILLPLLALALPCKAQNKEFDLLGTWKQTEHLGNDGAKDYVVAIENGPIFTFTKEGMVLDKSAKKVTYTFIEKKLCIRFPDQTYYYMVYPDEKNTKKMFVTPVTPEYQFICDEGCADVYVKTDL